MANSKEHRIRIATDELIGHGKLDAMGDYFTTGYVLHTGGKDHKGLAVVERFVKLLRTAIPNVRVVGVEILMRGDDTLAWRRTLRGTHRADMLGIPPTDKRVEWRDMLVSRFEGGKIAEEWAVSDLAEKLLLAQPRA